MTTYVRPSVFLSHFIPCYSSFMENVGPIMDEEAQKSGVTAQQVVQEVLSQTAGGQTGKSELYV